MTELNKLMKSTTRGKKRLGQGEGSGKGKTAGRGTKGQKARDSIERTTGGGILRFIRQMPLYRGKFRNKPVHPRMFPVNVKFLNLLEKDTVVTMETLVKKKIISADLGTYKGVKILGDGELTVSLKVMVPCSNGAKKKIEKAGGTVVVEVSKKLQEAVNKSK